MTRSPYTEGSRRIGPLDAIRRRKEVVAASILVVAGGVLLASLLEQPRYEATASVLVRSEGGAGPSRTEVVEFAQADAIARAAGKRLGGADPDFVSDRIEVAPGGAPDLFDVEGASSSPDFAARLANRFAEELVDYTAELGDSFEGRAEFVERADPPGSPSSPNTVRNTLLGALAGLVAGIAIAFAWERRDPRVRAARELGGLLGVPLLGRVPESPALGLNQALRELPAADAETFQIVRVGIRYLDVDREIRSVLLTSPEAGDGKTTVTFGLAVSAATSGDRVLVIEADMRQPGLSAVTEPAPAGLSSILAGQATLADALMTVEVTVGAEGVSGSIDVLQAGPAPPNPTQLIEAPRMAQLLYEAERDYDLVVIDTPPATILPDAIPLMGHVDGVIVVAGLGRDGPDGLRELRDQLEQVDAPVIGVIANFAEAPDESYFAYLREHEAAVAEAGAGGPRPAPEAPASGAAVTPTRRAARGRALREAGPGQRARPKAAAPTPAPPDGPVDLNEVTYDELRALDLSITQAKRLLAYRERRGGFSSVSDIDDVPGFPDEVREQLKRRLAVR